MADEPVNKPEVLETATASESEAKPAVAARRRKNRRNVSAGQVHVLATFNNTIVTVTDDKGGAIATASAGSSGFRGSKKGTAYAAQVAAEKALSLAKQNFGLEKADVYVKGIGLGRDAAIRTMISQKLNVENIYDVTGVPHGGVRPRKAKRN